MPASTVSSSLSLAAYFAAALGLLALLYPGLNSVSQAARMVAARDAVDGAAYVIGGLSPGVTAVLGPCAVQLEVGGHSVSAAAGDSSFTSRSPWLLPALTLPAGSSYRLSLNGSEVVVSPVD